MPKVINIKSNNHGHCTVCCGLITSEQFWTFTGQLNRVHYDPDDCIAILHPNITKRFLKANPNYVKGQDKRRLL